MGKLWAGYARKLQVLRSLVVPNYVLALPNRDLDERDLNATALIRKLDSIVGRSSILLLLRTPG
jgi:hypothetical protein